jgi:carboxyl-terminal processing protease
MSERALFDVLAGMLRGLGDSHVGLTAKVGTETLRHDESTSRTLALLSERARAEGRPARDVEREWLRAYRDGILQRVLGGGGRQAANGRILWGFARPGIGYLNVLTMGGFVADGSPREELAALDATLDEALAAFAGADAVIVDVSNNRGGHDLLARAIASRFADQPRHAYTKRAHRADGVPPQPFQVEPSSRRRFTGRVYLVTSDVTVSAGEIFTLAMRALPNVTHAGTSTRGALSDMLEKPLPNGWTVELSNEVYLDPAGEAFEGRGIPPAEAFEPFPRDDLSNGHAVALGRLAERLAAAAAPSR